ncbi:phosphodiesterase [Burkholderia vietnamiensis]|uniref:phosphodiesterase n=1 Tax=Burkholderia vietnamiensis TaxID=60552 RepID=UPI001B9151FD|nr:phosphodiesterase [Burkholderia vietnamiensis]MBR8006548.1 phosphodiesterase [Burkholderia vietnamiensis]MDN7814706.1 phosphodiesterase [Burkholderia vietnamiensis]MDN8042347.1 phosphodiesterase [Burkholderia vietnamiensis]HDR9131352.1 phosphodiesterase [Burkholderia vietnamiensis]
MDFSAEIEAAASAAEREAVSDSVQEVVPGRTLHLDGDYAAYFCAGGSETSAATARFITDQRIETATRMAGATRCVIHLTHAASDKGKRFHAASVKPYQGQRQGHKPKNWRFVREYLELAPYKPWERLIWRDREADDGMGLASNRMNPVRDTVIHTRDKDMRMLPGTHLTWTDYLLVHVPLGAYEVIGPDKLVYGTKWFWLQMLQGDTADHIPGLEKHEGKNCGEVTAAELLAGTASNADAYGVVAAAYRGHYGDEWADRFVEQAALLWIRRTHDAPVHEFISCVPAGSDLLPAVRRLHDRIQMKEVIAHEASQQD